MWWVPLVAADETLARFETVLSPKERARADRFRFPALRRDFVAAHGILRHLLSRYTGIAADAIEFTEGVRGKPALAAPGPIRFNISHSGGVGLYAISNGLDIGVDVEQHRELGDLRAVAAHYFAPEEIEELEGMAEAGRNAAFFRCWSRKEAFVKALGDGFSWPLDSFFVSVSAEAGLVAGKTGERREWQFFDLRPAAGYAAALVTSGAPGSIRCTRVEDAAKLLVI